jgi:predicted O-methyltransferase YrrM
MKKRTLGYDALLRMASYFQVSKMLLVANGLDLFTHLSRGPLSASELASLTEGNKRALEILCNALVGLDVIGKSEGKFFNGPGVEEMLVKGKPGYKGDMLRHIHDGWEAWSDLQGVIMRGYPQLQEEDQFLIHNRQRTEAFIKGMFQTGCDMAIALSEKMDLSKYRNMLDLGGGPGTYSIVFTEHYPSLKATVFDLPLTIEIARQFIAQFKANDRVKTKVGDFYEGDFGTGYDLVLISQILHSQTVDQCKILLRKAYSALDAGGLLVVHDLFLNDDRTMPPNAAVFAVHMLAVTKGGRAYSASEVEDWLTAAGFRGIGHREATARSSMLLAEK